MRVDLTVHHCSHSSCNLSKENRKPVSNVCGRMNIDVTRRQARSSTAADANTIQIALIGRQYEVYGLRLLVMTLLAVRSLVCRPVVHSQRILHHAS